MNQKGFAPLLILVALAAVIGISAVAYGIFITQKPQTPETEIPIMENSSSQQSVQIGTPECPELDYTGCDTSQNFMTWTDDGIR